MLTQGFSLLGHVIVVFVIGLTFSIALPGLNEFWNSNTGLSYGQGFQHALKYTRSLAVLGQQPVSLCSTEDGVTCANRLTAKQFLVFRDINKNHQRDDSEHIIRLFDLREGTWHYRWRAFRRKPSITFLPSGLTYDNGTFNLCSGKHLLGRLVLSRSGRTRKERNNSLMTLSCPH